MAELKEPTDLKGKVEVTPEQMINKLRGVVQPPGKKGTWLRNLNDRQLAEVYHRLRLNQSAYHIAKIAQRDWKVMVKSETKSLCRALKEFRDKSLGLFKAYESSFPRTEEKKDFVDKQEKKAEQIVKKVDGLDELAWLITVQKERIDTLRIREKSSLPFKFTDKSIEVLCKLLDTYLNYQVELGVLKAKPREIDLRLKAEFEGLLAGVIPDDGERIISASARLLELADRKALILKRGDDGKFSVEKKREDTCEAD